MSDRLDEIEAHGDLLCPDEKYLLGRARDEMMKRRKAVAALRTVLARVQYSMVASDWTAPMPGRDDGYGVMGLARTEEDDLADAAQYPGRLEDWLEQQIAAAE